MKKQVFRKLVNEKVEEIARGRVWSGKKAKEHGLVDELGGMFDAIYRAKKEAGIPLKQKLDLVTFDSKTSNIPTIGELLQIKNTLLAPEISSIDTIIKQYQKMSNEHIWMMMPYQITIK